VISRGLERDYDYQHDDDDGEANQNFLDHGGCFSLVFPNY
jgi:replication-associated recombination protein RarA